jgi:hypothetical protein
MSRRRRRRGGVKRRQEEAATEEEEAEDDDGRRRTERRKGAAEEPDGRSRKRCSDSGTGWLRRGADKVAHLGGAGTWGWQREGEGQASGWSNGSTEGGMEARGFPRCGGGDRDQEAANENAAAARLKGKRLASAYVLTGGKRPRG